MDDADAGAAQEPLTKAKLFAATVDDGAWTEMGLGVVSVVTHPATTGDGAAPPTGGSGKVGGAATVRRSAKLEMVALDDARDVLLSTPLTLEDVYMVQHEAILVWSDPQLGREMACSFNSKDGCEKIMADIQEYQRTERQGLAGSLQDERIQPIGDRWSVSEAHLHGILESATTNVNRFGIYVRDHLGYFRQLADLFDVSKVKGDSRSMELIAAVTLALLRPPFNTEGKIIAQFMEESMVDRTIDIVQYGLGRRDSASGFVSFEERRATFRDPCHLPPYILSRIHVLYACGYLKDLLPLSLEEGDAKCASMLETFLVRFKFSLYQEVCRTDSILPRAFVEAKQRGGPALYPLAAFVNDMSKSVSGSAMALELKEEVYALLVEAGLFAFINAALCSAVQDYAADSAQCPAEEPLSERRHAAAAAIQACCETVGHCSLLLPSARENLLTEAASNPQGSTLAVLLRCVTLMRSSSGLQAAYAAIAGAGVGLKSFQFLLTPAAVAQRGDILRFWVEGSGVERPPLFCVAAHVAALLRPAQETSGGGLNRGAELQVMYGIKVLQLIVDELETGFVGSLQEILSLSDLLPALRATLARRQRAVANVQSSIVSLLAGLVGFNCGALLELLSRHSLLEASVELYLQCCHRDNILTAALAHLLLLISAGLHREKALSVREAAPSLFVKPLTAGAVPHRTADGSSSTQYQDTLSALLAAYGDRLAESAPVVVDRWRKALAETPAEAQSAEAETSSIASTFEHNGPLSDVGEFEALAAQFGVDISSRSPSRSPTSDPITDAAQAALLELSENSMDELDLDDTGSSASGAPVNGSPCEPSSGSADEPSRKSADAKRPRAAPGADGEDDEEAAQRARLEAAPTAAPS